MVGGGRRDEGSLVINNTNVFAALETLRKKKKSDKERGSSKSGKGSSKSQQSQLQQKEPEPEVFWAPAPLNAKSWADVDDEDDDDYYATTAPPQAVWASSEPQHSHEKPSNVEGYQDTLKVQGAIKLFGEVHEANDVLSHIYESESEDDILDEGDDEVDEDHEKDVTMEPEPVVKKTPEASVVPKETERQLSKKERKKKELAELEALLADFGVSQKDSNGQAESRDAAQEGKDPEPIAEGEKKDSAPGESKSAKKKKKKDKSKEAKETQDQSGNSEVVNGADEAEQVEEDSSGVDVKERLKRMASSKKKKSSKEMDAAAKAAAQEAAARSARLAAAKKKEKNHYNQQPVR